MQTGTVSRLWLCGRSWRFEIISGGTLCVSGSHTFVPINWMCKKQTSVSHSSTEYEIISLDTGLRLDGLPALELWDLMVSVLGNMTQTTERLERLVILDRSQRSHGKTNALIDIDCAPSNVQSSHQEALLYVFQDNEAVIKMIIKGRSPTMRHVSRTTELLLIGFLIESIWTPRSKSNTPKKPPCWHANQRKFQMWWVESYFVFV